MKKLLLFLLLVASFFISKAQIFSPSSIWGIHQARAAYDSVLYFPTGCGSPTDTSFLRSFGFVNNGQRLRMWAIYGDSCGNAIWLWNPSTKHWIGVSPSVLDTTSLSTRINNKVTNTGGMQFWGSGNTAARPSPTAGVGMFYNTDSLWFEYSNSLSWSEVPKPSGGGGGSFDSTSLDIHSTGFNKTIFVQRKDSAANETFGYVTQQSRQKLADSLLAVLMHRYDTAAGPNWSYITWASRQKLADSILGVVLHKYDTAAGPNFTYVTWASRQKLADSINALLNLKVTNLGGASFIGGGTFASRPSSPTGTGFWYASDTKVLYYWNGSAWAQATDAPGSNVQNFSGAGMGINKGTFLSRPSAASLTNSFYWSTDSVFWSYSDGTIWKDLKPGTGGGAGSFTTVPLGPIQTFHGTGVDSLAIATEIGMTFNKSSFSSIATDFPTNTGSFTTSSGHIITGAGTGADTTKYISMADVGYNNRWVKGYIMIAPTKTSTSLSPMIGVRSLVSTFIASQLGWVDLSTGADAGKTFYQGKGVAVVKSTMALTWNALDSILVYTKRFDDTLWVTAINIMAARPSIATVKYIFTSAGSASLENKGVTTIWSQGDVATIVNVFTVSHDLKYSNLGVLGDSKGQLYNSSSFYNLWTKRVIDFYGTGVNYCQTGAKSQDFIDEEPDILAHHFKQVLIQFGCNDVTGLSTYQTNIVLFYNWCKANGIRPIVMSVTYESARNLDAMYVWQSDPTRPWVIDGNWVDDYTITKNGTNMLALDGIHLLDHAEDSITTRTIDQAVINGGINSLKGNASVKATGLGDIPYIAGIPDAMLGSPLNYNGTDSLISMKNVTFTANRFVMAGTGTNHAPFFPAFYIGDQTLGPLQYVMVSQSGILKFLKFSGSADVFDFNNLGQSSYPQAGSSLCLGCGIQSAAGLVSHSTSGARTAIVTQGQIDLGNSDFGGASAGADAALYLRNQNTGAKENSVSANNNGLLFAAANAAMVLSRTLPNIGLNGILSPTAHFHIDAGSTTDPSFKIDGGSLLTTPQNYAWEVTTGSSGHAYWTDGAGVRHQLDQQGGGSTPTIDQVLNVGNQAANATWGFNGFWAKLNGLRSDTNTIAHVLVKGADSVLREVTPIQLAAILPGDTTSYQMSVVGTTNSLSHDTVTLVNDQASPAANMVYGTNNSAVRGWQGPMFSSTYTPTLTNTTNITTSNLNRAIYYRIGNNVHVSIDCGLVPTLVGTASVLTITLPITTATAQGNLGQGSIGYNGGSLYNNGIVGYTNSTTVLFSFISAASFAGSSANVNISFDYSL